VARPDNVVDGHVVPNYEMRATLGRRTTRP
jgi:hypothetical protein